MHWFNRYLLTLAILFCQKNMLKSCIFKSIDFTIRSRLGHTVSTYVKIWIVLCVHCIICEFTWNWIKVMGFVKNVSQTLNYCRGYWNSSAYFNPLCRLSHHEQMFSLSQRPASWLKWGTPASRGTLKTRRRVKIWNSYWKIKDKANQ